jgi:hypothetical protein
MTLSPRSHKVFGYIFGAFGIGWIFYFGWIVLFWITTNFSWGRMLLRWYEQTLMELTMSIIGLPLAMILIGITMGGWALLPLWLAVGIDRIQKRMARTSAT